MNGVNGQPISDQMSPNEGDAGKSGKVTSGQLLKLLDVQHKRCALTGVDLTPQTVSLDHITPLEYGGADDMGNVQLVHSTINAMKGTMGQGEFIHWCKQVASHFIEQA